MRSPQPALTTPGVAAGGLSADAPLTTLAAADSASARDGGGREAVTVVFGDGEAAHLESVEHAEEAVVTRRDGVGQLQCDLRLDVGVEPGPTEEPGVPETLAGEGGW